jgi:hypothetical protein
MGLTPMGRRGYFNVSASEGNDRNVSFMPGFNPVSQIYPYFISANILTSKTGCRVAK